MKGSAIRDLRHPRVDAANTFVDQGFQWEYPVQVWAERGYVVVCFNEGDVSQNSELSAAYDQWASNTKGVSVDSMQRWAYFNEVESLEAAIDALVERGLIDRERIGIAGYSRGSQIVNVTMTQSRSFRAASSGMAVTASPPATFYGGYITGLTGAVRRIAV